MNERGAMSEAQTLTRLKEIAQRLGRELEGDENNLSLVIFGSVATDKILKKPDLDLLLVTKTAPPDTEPENMEETIIDNETVQITRITPECLEEGIRKFVDYRINQIRDGVIVFDKEGLVSKIKKMLEERRVPPREVLEAWLFDLQEDQKALLQKLENKVVNFTISNNIN